MLFESRWYGSAAVLLMMPEVQGLPAIRHAAGISSKTLPAVASYLSPACVRNTCSAATMYSEIASEAVGSAMSNLEAAHDHRRRSGTGGVYPNVRCVTTMPDSRPSLADLPRALMGASHLMCPSSNAKRFARSGTAITCKAETSPVSSSTSAAFPSIISAPGGGAETIAWTWT